MRTILLSFFLVIISIFYYLFFTQTGFKTDLELLQHFLPGKLTIAKTNGTLAAFSLQDLRYDDDHVSITLQKFALTWQPLALINFNVNLQNINMQHANIILVKPPTAVMKKSKNSPSSYHLDWFNYIHIGDLFLDKINIIYKNKQTKTIILHAFLDGHLNHVWNLAVKGALNLKEVDKALTGNIVFDSHFTGDFNTPAANLHLQIKNFSALQQRIKQLVLDANLNSKPKTLSTITIQAKNITFYDYAINKIHINLQGSAIKQRQMLRVNLTSEINNTLYTDADIIFPHFTTIFDWGQKINASIHLKAQELSSLALFIPTINKVSGNMNAHIDINGKIHAPNIKTTLNVTNASLHIKALGITPTAITITCNQLNEKIHFKGNFQSGNGNGKLTGEANINQNYDFNVTLDGENLTVMHLPQYKIVLTPNIILHYTNSLLTLTGKLFVPSALIAPTRFDNTLTMPDEVIYLDSKESNTALPFTTALRLELRLGKDINVHYQDLATMLRGKMNITKTADGLVLATGDLFTHKGTYKAYGKTLAIQMGRLSYTGGSILNPGLNVTAIKKIKVLNMDKMESNFANTTLNQTPLPPVYTGSKNEITVGVRVTGTLNAPYFNLFSDPSMNQGDILSYLLLGYPQSQIKGQQASSILSALSALNPNTSQFGNITNVLQNKLGLNDLKIESTQIFDPNTNSLVSTTTVGVGKQLAPNLYVHYTTGLFYSVMIFNLRYQLSKHWALQSESSTVDNGADFLYSIEH